VKSYVIEGGHALKGTIKISGSKNATLPCMAASILTNESVVLENVPNIKDVNYMVDCLNTIGARASLVDGKLLIEASNTLDSECPQDISKLFRGSTLLLGSLLARNSRVRIYGYGGCPIGSRPIDLHLKVFKALGADVNITSHYIEVSAERLVGSKIHLEFPSVGATENGIMAATLAEGETVLTNVAVEPEVKCLIDMLRSMGAKIELDVNKRVVRVVGVRELKGVRHKIIPDRIEAGTYMIAALLTDGDLTVEEVNLEHLRNILSKFLEMGIELEIAKGNKVRIFSSEKTFKPLEIITEPYPGFPTDMQPQFTVLLSSKTRGTSVIHETIYENRFHHVPELNKMGARIKVSGRKIIIQAPVKLRGTRVLARDIRGGAALVLAALNAEGETLVEGIEHIERGYEKIHEKLMKVGARIEVLI